MSAMRASAVWLPRIVDRVARFLSPTEIACTLRLVDTTAEAALTQRNEVSLKAPVPRHAFKARWASPGACRSLTRTQRHQLIQLTAASGDLVNLEVAVAAAGVVLTAADMAAAAAAGSLDACRWLLQRGCPIDEHVLTAAAAANQQAACEWVLAQGVELKFPPIIATARAGHEELMDWLFARWTPSGYETDIDHFLYKPLQKAVAEGCDLAAMQRCWERVGVPLRPHAAAWAAQYVISEAAGSPTRDWREKVSWLLAQGAGLACDTGHWAAALPTGATRLQQLADEFGFVPEGCGLHSCVHRASPDSLRWLLERHREALQPEHFDRFSSSGEWHGLEKLRIVHGAGLLARPEGALVRALAAGDLEAAAWLLELSRAAKAGFELSAEHSAWAATSGSVAMLTWLREQGCPFDASAWQLKTDVEGEFEQYLLGATASGSEQALEHLAAAGCEMPADGSPFVTAARNGDLHTLGALQRLGVPFGPSDGAAFASAVHGEHALFLGGGANLDTPAPALELLVTIGFPVCWRTAVEAAEYRPVEAWVRQQQKAAEGRTPSPDASEERG